MAGELLVALFVITTGLTVSGIVANLYRLAIGGAQPAGNKALYLAVMVVAGPSVLFDKAARARLKKECSHIAFWLAAAIAAYWCLVIGLFVVEVALSL